MYFSDNNGDFPHHKQLAHTDRDILWVPVLEPYYEDPNSDIMLCPYFRNPIYDKNGEPTGIQPVHAAWGIYTKQEINRLGWEEELIGMKGCYGWNDWAAYPRRMGPSGNKSLQWLSILSVYEPGKVPLFMDAAGSPRVRVFETDEPPLLPEQGIGGSGHMRNICIPRHQDGINILFCDFSVKQVGITDFWNLRWHRQWPVDAQEPDWSQYPGIPRH